MVLDDVTYPQAEAAQSTGQHHHLTLGATHRRRVLQVQRRCSRRVDGKVIARQLAGRQ